MLKNREIEESKQPSKNTQPATTEKKLKTREEFVSKPPASPVDCFDCNNIEMLVGNHKVKIDSKAINRLLGIPKEGLNLILIKRVRKLSGYAATWRDLYQSDFVVASEIVERIMSSKDESVMFEIDFIVLFLTAMVECMVNMISEVVHFKDINRSIYVVDKLRHCKNNWNRMNTSSYFTGGLTILTLLYVDSFTCPKINIDTKQMPVEFWTTQMLNIRERLEIENGGFGLGELRSMCNVTEDPGKNVQKSGEKLQDLGGVCLQYRYDVIC
ncbi:hypothetical protein R6Q57_009256 [Mikania cordata]